MRLIDVDALLETMEDFFTKVEDEARYAGRRNAEVTWNDAVYMIKTAPTIEPERKKGKWIEIEDFYNRISGRCSVCGWESHMYDDDVVGMEYCPNCGARMLRGGRWMITIKLTDARRGLYLKCRELFGDEKIAGNIYNYLCEGIEECEECESEQKTEWIPCSERLPEDRLYVLVTYKYEYGFIDMGIAAYSEAKNEWDTPREVVAWMPLPKPFEEEIKE